MLLFTIKFIYFTISTSKQLWAFTFSQVYIGGGGQPGVLFLLFLQIKRILEKEFFVQRSSNNGANNNAPEGNTTENKIADGGTYCSEIR